MAKAPGNWQSKPITLNPYFKDCKALVRRLSFKKVKSKRYYIIDYRKLKNLRLLPFVFKSYIAAKWILRYYYKDKEAYKQYSVISGEDAKRYSVKFVCKKSDLPVKRIIRYEYPTLKLSSTRKKTYRTLQRRRIRIETDNLRPYDFY